MYAIRSYYVFYRVKGRMYGYYMVLKGLGKDFDAVIRDKESYNFV